MGRHKKVMVIEDPSNVELPTESEIRYQEKEEKKRIEMEEWLKEFQGRFTDQPAKILIEKFEEGEWAICRKYPLAAYDHEAVREEWGGGKYRATLLDPGGRYVEGGRNNFKFAQPITKFNEREKPPANPFDNPVVALMIENMRNQTTQMLELTKSMIAGGGANKSDLGQVITAVKGIQDLAGPKEKPYENFKETLGMMKLVKEITGNSDSEEKGGLLSEIREFLEIYPSIKERLAELKPAAAPMVPAPPPTMQPERSNASLDPLSQKIVELVPLFVQAGKKAEPIERWGAFLLEKTDTEIVPLLLPALKKQYGPLVKDEDDVYDILLRLGRDAAEREKIFAQIPPLAPFRDWVGRVLDEAIRLAETEETDDVIVNAVTGNGRTPPAGVEV